MKTQFQNPPKKNYSFSNISCSVVFGNPQRGCGGSGVCKVIPASSALAEKLSCRQVRVQLEWTQAGCMHWHISPTDVCPSRMERWKASQQITIPADFALPLWLSKIVGGAYRIPAGQYSLVFGDQGEDITVVLPYQEMQMENRLSELRTQVA